MLAPRPVWEATGDTDALQQVLKDNGCRGVEAVFVITNLLNCDLAEVQQAFFNAPCREAERRFHDHAMDLLAEAADSDAWQHQRRSRGV
jgi:endo-1,4-beta-D-glucanase Y